MNNLLNTDRLKAITSIWMCLLLIFIVNVEINVIAVMLNNISKDLSISLKYAQWIGSIYMIFFSSSVLIAGKLGDIFGNDKIYLIGILSFGLSTLGCAIATNLPMIILMRIIQGIGGALIWPNCTAIILKHDKIYPKGKLIGLFTASVGLAIAAGPVIGGIFTDTYGWRSFFAITFFIVFIVGFIDMFLLKNRNKKVNKKINLRIDYISLLLIVIFLLCVSIFINGLGDWQLKYLSLCFIFAIISLTLYLFRISRESYIFSPIIDIQLLKNFHLFLGCIIRFFFQSAFMGFTYLFSIYLISYYKLTPFITGVSFSVCTIFLFFGAIFSGKLMDSGISKLKISIIGIIIMIFAYICMLFTTVVINFYYIEFIIALLGIGYAITSPMLLAISTTSTLEKDYGAATGMYFMFSTFGNAIGIITAGFYSQLMLNSSYPESFSKLNIIYISFCLLIVVLLTFLRLKEISAIRDQLVKI